MGDGFLIHVKISKVNSPGHAEFSLTHQIFAHSCLFVYQGIFRHFPIYKTGSRPIPESTAYSHSSNIQFLNFLLLFLLQNLRLFQHLFCLFLCLLRSLIFYRKFTDADKDPRDSKGIKTYAGTEGVAEGSYTSDTEGGRREGT